VPLHKGKEVKFKEGDRVYAYVSNNLHGFATVVTFEGSMLSKRDPTKINVKFDQYKHYQEDDYHEVRSRNVRKLTKLELALQ
jgi:hypothetical protein